MGKNDEVLVHRLSLYVKFFFFKIYQLKHSSKLIKSINIFLKGCISPSILNYNMMWEKSPK